jgi:hypothetical protein
MPRCFAGNTTQRRFAVLKSNWRGLGNMAKAISLWLTIIVEISADKAFRAARTPAGLFLARRAFFLD